MSKERDYNKYLLKGFMTWSFPAVLKKVVLAMHKCERNKDNRWFDYVDKLCCYEIVS